MPLVRAAEVTKAVVEQVHQIDTEELARSGNIAQTQHGKRSDPDDATGPVAVSVATIVVVAAVIAIVVVFGATDGAPRDAGDPRRAVPLRARVRPPRPRVAPTDALGVVAARPRPAHAVAPDPPGGPVRAVTNPWTDVYGLARSCLAFGLLLTLVFTRYDALFDPANHAHLANHARWIIRANLFVVLGDHPGLARALAIATLLLVVSGWRPRWTALPHWWVAVSFATAARAPDGGDHVHLVLATLLLPVALTDARRWHWHPALPRASTPGADARAFAVGSFLVIATVQVAAIYLHASVGKLGVTEWANGTAVYYWFTDPLMGAPRWMRPILDPILRSPVGVMALTWGTIGLEALLAIGPLLAPRARRRLLVAGLCFHLGIVLVHGLVTFFCSMAAALVLLLRRPDEPFDLRAVARAVAPILARLPRPRRSSLADPARTS
jgi:antimicrobial peptide system SdpB family protein